MDCPSCGSIDPIWRCVKAIRSERSGNLATVRHVLAQCSQCGQRYVLASVRVGDRWEWIMVQPVKTRSTGKTWNVA